MCVPRKAAHAIGRDEDIVAVCLLQQTTSSLYFPLPCSTFLAAFPGPIQTISVVENERFEEFNIHNSLWLHLLRASLDR